MASLYRRGSTQARLYSGTALYRHGSTGMALYRQGSTVMALVAGTALQAWLNRQCSTVYKQGPTGAALQARVYTGTALHRHGSTGAVLQVTSAANRLK